MTKNRAGNWMSTSVTIAAHASASGEIDIRGFVPTKLILATSSLSPAAYIGFKGRPLGYSTSTWVYDSDNSRVLQVAINSTAKVYPIPTNGLTGLSFVKLISKTSGLSSTSVWNQTRGCTIYVEGIG